jgi:hypothetical protein
MAWKAVDEPTKGFPFVACDELIKEYPMSMQWKAVWTGLFVLVLTNAAYAISIKDFYNDDAVSDETRAAAKLFSFYTEAYRSDKAGLNARAQCIDENFFGEKPGAIALKDHMKSAKNKDASAESYVLMAVKVFCPPSGAAEVSPKSPPYTFKPSSVQDFYDIVPDNANKITVLNFILGTQAERVKQAGDKARSQCIEGLEVKISKDIPPVIPPAFKQDIMLKLATAVRNPSSGDSLESILMNAIAKNCDNKGG